MFIRLGSLPTFDRADDLFLPQTFPTFAFQDVTSPGSPPLINCFLTLSPLDGGVSQSLVPVPLLYLPYVIAASALAVGSQQRR